MKFTQTQKKGRAIQVAVRNFYVNAFIDGRKTNLSGGPAGKESGILLDYFQKDEGKIVTAFSVKSYVRHSLDPYTEKEVAWCVTEVFDNSGECVHTFRTKR